MNHSIDSSIKDAIQNKITMGFIVVRALASYLASWHDTRIPSSVRLLDLLYHADY
jgi:hypothetical protein